MIVEVSKVRRLREVVGHRRDEQGGAHDDNWFIKGGPGRF